MKTLAYFIATLTVCFPALFGGCNGGNEGNDTDTSEKETVCETTEMQTRAWWFCNTTNNEAFAVGDSDLLRYDGSAWSTMNTGGLPGTVHGIWCSSGSDIFVVGIKEGKSMIAHYNGSTWTEMEHPVGYEKATAIWGSGSNDVYAIGRKNSADHSILHFNGQNWSEMKTSIGSEIDQLWGASGTDIYAVGTAYSYYHYNGHDWENIQLPDDMMFYQIHDAWGPDTNSVYFVGGTGEEGAPSNPVIAKKVGSTWSKTIIEIPYDGMVDTGEPEYWLLGIWGYGENSIFVTGNRNGYYWDGNKWNEGKDWYGYDVWGDSAQKTFFASTKILEVTCQ